MQQGAEEVAVKMLDRTIGVIQQLGDEQRSVLSKCEGLAFARVLHHRLGAAKAAVLSLAAQDIFSALPAPVHMLLTPDTQPIRLAGTRI